jgi:5-methylcytosine-specific restriction endonuclease McrA
MNGSPKEGVKIKFFGDQMHLLKKRLLNFRYNGTKCVACGKQGVYFAKERYENEKTVFLNLYAFDKYGQELLMTCDHIKPKSKGGKDRLYNYQPMCFECNKKKSNIYSLKDRIRLVINYIKFLFIKVY